MSIFIIMVLHWYGGSGAEMAQQMRQPWVPPMDCRSACAWGAASDPNVCIQRKAVFWFHGWRDPGTGKLMKAVNKLRVSELPTQMQEIARRDWVNKDLFKVTGAELIALGKAECKP